VGNFLGIELKDGQNSSTGREFRKGLEDTGSLDQPSDYVPAGSSRSPRNWGEKGVHPPNMGIS